MKLHPRSAIKHAKYILVQITYLEYFTHNNVTYKTSGKKNDELTYWRVKRTCKGLAPPMNDVYIFPVTIS